ncbi:hypothetical protein [Iamia sp.]|uniref:hypothetical protein n=1 Tax=Iamia sp. TaxID=2722710 RepID=UPI002BE8A817|nr:hypothetical protein [Iamia sp.]HXH55968.1 hypothetical protein [Iamia sp.]
MPGTEARGPARRRNQATVAAVTLAVVAVHLWASRSVPGPTITYDEAGYLGNARWLAGQDPTFEMPLSPYYAFGYSAVIAPLHWVTDDPDVLWRAIMSVNAVLLGSLVPLLHQLARRVLGVAFMPALLSAAVGALSPAVLGTGGRAVAENLSLPLVVATVLALHAALSPGRAVPRLVLGPTVAALYASHPRFVPVVALCGIGLLLALVRPVLPRALAAGNLVGLVAGVLAVRAVDGALVAARWRAVATLEGTPGDVVDLATSSQGVRALGRSALGQGWYVGVGTLGIAVVGLWAVFRIAAGRPIVAEGGATPPAARLTAIGALAMAAGVFAVSIVFFARNDTRDDHLIYGRHNDCFVPMWIAAGIALVVSETRRARLARTIGAVAAVTALVSAAVIVALNPVTHGGDYRLRAIPAFSRVLEGAPDGVFVRGSVTALVGLATLAALALLVRRPTLAAVALTLWFAWVGIARVELTEASTQRAYAGWRAPDDLERLGVREAAIDVRTAQVAVVTYQFALPGVRFLPYLSGRDPRPDTPFVLAALTDAALIGEGARLALIDEGGALTDREPSAVGLWVRPGPDLRRLDAAGRLLPAGFPSALPPTARRASFQLVGQPSDVEVDAGETVSFDVAVRHDGTGSPWPDRGSAGGRGSVYVRARVTPVGSSDDDAVTEGRVELPRWMDPGDEAIGELELSATDRAGDPLPQGRYRVELALAQRGSSWVAGGGGDSTFTFVVD